MIRFISMGSQKLQAVLCLVKENRNHINFNKLMNAYSISNLRSLVNYLRIAFQRRKKSLSSTAIEKEYLPLVARLFEIL